MTRTEQLRALRVSLTEMREACAAAMRVIVDSGQTEAFVRELRAAGVQDGFGARASALLARSRRTSPEPEEPTRAARNVR